MLALFSIKGLTDAFATTSCQGSNLVGLLLLGGCDDQSRPGTWHAKGANDANLRSMLVRPADIVSGLAAQEERAKPATLAIRRLDFGRRKSLPDSRASAIGAGVDPQPQLPEQFDGR